MVDCLSDENLIAQAYLKARPEQARDVLKRSEDVIGILSRYQNGTFSIAEVKLPKGHPDFAGDKRWHLYSLISSVDGQLLTETPQGFISVNGCNIADIRDVPLKDIEGYKKAGFFKRLSSSNLQEVLPDRSHAIMVDVFQSIRKKEEVFIFPSFTIIPLYFQDRGAK